MRGLHSKPRQTHQGTHADFVVEHLPATSFFGIHVELCRFCPVRYWFTYGIDFLFCVMDGMNTLTASSTLSAVDRFVYAPLYLPGVGETHPTVKETRVPLLLAGDILFCLELTGAWQLVDGIRLPGLDFSWSWPLTSNRKKLLRRGDGWRAAGAFTVWVEKWGWVAAPRQGFSWNCRSVVIAYVDYIVHVFVCY